MSLKHTLTAPASLKTKPDTVLIGMSKLECEGKLGQPVSSGQLQGRAELDIGQSPELRRKHAKLVRDRAYPDGRPPDPHEDDPLKEQK